jgi:hypothetical protein
LTGTHRGPIPGAPAAAAFAVTTFASSHEEKKRTTFCNAARLLKKP